MDLNKVEMVLWEYGAGLDDEHFIVSPNGKTLETKVKIYRGRAVFSGKGVKLASCGDARGVEQFVERFWFWEKLK